MSIKKLIAISIFIFLFVSLLCVLYKVPIIISIIVALLGSVLFIFLVLALNKFLPLARLIFCLCILFAYVIFFNYCNYKGMINSVLIVNSVSIIIFFISLITIYLFGIAFNKHYEIAYKAYSNGDFETAIQNYELCFKEHKLRNLDYNTIIHLCNLYRCEEKYDEALALINKYQDKCKESILKINIILSKISIFIKKGLIKESYNLLAECEAYINKPCFILYKNLYIDECKYRYIMLYALEGKFDKATETLDSIGKKNGNPNYNMSKGFVLEKMNKVAEALECYNEGLKDLKCLKGSNRINASLYKFQYIKAITKLGGSINT